MEMMQTTTGHQGDRLFTHAVRISVIRLMFVADETYSLTSARSWKESVKGIALTIQLEGHRHSEPRKFLTLR